MTRSKEQHLGQTPGKTTFPRFFKFILIVAGWQTYRFFAAIGFGDIELFGGSILPNAWVIPIWQDTMTGLLAPFIVYMLAKRPSILSYALGVSFFIFGIVDFTNGLIIDALYPSLNEIPKGAMAAWLSTNMLFEVLALGLFLTPGIRRYFMKNH